MPETLLSLAATLARCADLSASSLRRLLALGDFPKPVRLSRTRSGRPCRVAWVEREVDAWIAARIVREADVSELAALAGKLREAELLAEMKLRSVTLTNGNGREAEGRLLAMPEVAQRLGITEHQAREMGRRGELPVVTVGARRVRVSAHALAEWIAVRERGSLPHSRRGR